MKLDIASALRSPAPPPMHRVFKDARHTAVAAEFIRARAERRARLVIPCDVAPKVEVRP